MNRADRLALGAIVLIVVAATAVVLTRSRWHGGKAKESEEVLWEASAVTLELSILRDHGLIRCGCEYQPLSTIANQIESSIDRRDLERMPSKDNWGREWAVRCCGRDIEVRSSGPDGILGNTDDTYDLQRY